MKIIGLTGNIGSGKSTVADVFSNLGISVYHADNESKKLLFLPEIKFEIGHVFGDVFNPDGEIDKKKLASIVFSDPKSLSKLNQILHPGVRNNFHQWLGNHKNESYVIQEAAIIFESGFRNEFDKIIHVSCPEQIAMQRVIKRDNITEKDFYLRSSSQMNEKEKAALSDFIILNDGSHLIIPQILLIHSSILEICP